MHVWQITFRKIRTIMYPRSWGEQVHDYPHNFCIVDKYYNTTVLTSTVLVTQYRPKCQSQQVVIRVKNSATVCARLMKLGHAVHLVFICLR